MRRREFLASSAATGLMALVPPPAAASLDGVIDLVAGMHEVRLFGESYGASPLWLYNGLVPGPEIRVKQGERLRVRLTNILEHPTTIHWHGIRIDNAMDGVSGLTQEPVQPGEQFEYDFVAPDAGTYWYHAHHESWNQVPRGLFGALIVEEPERLYDQEHDITLVLNDWLIDEDGVFHEGSMGATMHWSHAGRLGNWLTVNGASQPAIPIRAGEWHRVRLINASSARVLDIDPSAFGANMIARDGQAFGEVREVTGPLKLSPGQRLDLVLRPEEEGLVALNLAGDDPITFAYLDVREGARDESEPPIPSASTLPEPDLTGAREVPLYMEGGAMGGLERLVYNGETLEIEGLLEARQFWGFNGTANMTEEPLFKVRTGETVVIDMENGTAWEHAMHLHGHHVHVLERNGEAQAAREIRDTFHVDLEERVKVAFVADNPGKWLLHCHMLGHAAAGMVNWFEVT